MGGLGVLGPKLDHVAWPAWPAWPSWTALGSSWKSWSLHCQAGQADLGAGHDSGILVRAPLSVPACDSRFCRLVQHQRNMSSPSRRTRCPTLWITGVQTRLSPKTDAKLLDRRTHHPISGHHKDLTAPRDPCIYLHFSRHPPPVRPAGRIVSSQPPTHTQLQPC